MARKRVERNISFDDVRKVYYVSMDLGKNSEGKRVKQYRTFPNLTSARTGLREFYADRDKLLHPPKQEQTLRQWLGDELFGQVEDTIMEYGELREKEGFVNGYITAERSREP